MNEYQQKRWERHSADAERVVELVAALNEIDSEKWTVEPSKPDADNYPTNRHRIVSESGLVVVCNHNGYGLEDRWRFSAGAWPEYLDDQGHKRTMAACDLWNPKETSPQTEAADSRPWSAIAKQILTKLLTPYRAIYARCAEKAGLWQEGVDRNVAALEAMHKACGQPFDRGAAHNKTLYHNRMAKDSVRIEFRSEGDVILHMTTEQALKALEAIQ